MTAGIDMALALIEEDLGRKIPAQSLAVPAVSCSIRRCLSLTQNRIGFVAACLAFLPRLAFLL